MLLCKTVLLCSGIFVLIEAKNYGKNSYPKKYSHSIHKRVDPNYWDYLTLENNLLPVQLSSGKEFKNSYEQNEIFRRRPWLYRKNHVFWKDTHFPSQVILKRYKRDGDPKLKNGDRNPKKFYNKLQKDKRQSNNSMSNLSKYDKNKLLKKWHSFPIKKAFKM